jgi:hypothetical protein
MLGAGDFPSGRIVERTDPISEQAAVGDVCGIEFLPHHGFNGIAPEGDDCPDIKTRGI